MTGSAADLATRLIGVRGGGPLIETVSADDRPRDLAAALAVSTQVAGAQGARAGWKIGATAPGAPAALGLAEPLFAPIPKAGLREAPARWAAGPDGLTLDAEVVFELAATPADASLPALKAAVGSIRLGIEINRPSYVRPFEAGGLAIIADMGAHAGLVRGAALDHGADLAALEATLGDARRRGERGDRDGRGRARRSVGGSRLARCDASALWTGFAGRRCRGLRRAMFNPDRSGRGGPS
jgi:2-keto-4-pentenoate hydratase